MREVEITVAVPALATDKQVFDVLTDWPRHSEWMAATRAEVVEGTGAGEGSTLAAFTGLGPFGFLDTMVITRFEPPKWVCVRHTGRLIRGEGAFLVEASPSGGCVIAWHERLELPSAAARLWPLARPLAALFFRFSLRRLVRLAAEPPGRPAPRR